MIVKILGTWLPTTANAWKPLHVEAATQVGVNPEFEKVTQIPEIMAYGIMHTGSSLSTRPWRWHPAGSQARPRSSAGSRRPVRATSSTRCSWRAHRRGRHSASHMR